MSDTTRLTVARRSPEEVFGLLGNELRVSILLALIEDPTKSVSFSELRARVGERDSGKFNYHLKKLTGIFIQRTDAGYKLTVAGMQVVGAIVAGTYTADAEVNPIPVDDPCPNCRTSPIVVEYEEERAHLSCPSCESWGNRFTFPPGAIDQYEESELPAAFDRWMRTVFSRIVAGFCHNCAGRMRGELRDTRDDEAVEGAARIEWECERCRDLASASATLPLFYHPGFIGFAYDHGVDLATTPSWRTSITKSDIEMTVNAENPTRVEVEVTINDDVCSATIGPDGVVTAFERSDN